MRLVGTEQPGKSEHRKVAWALLFTLVLLTVAFTQPLLAVVLKFPVDILAMGVSFSKMYLFLAFTAFTLLISLFPSGSSERELRFPLLLVSLLSLLLGVAEQLAFTTRFGVEWRSVLTAYQNFEYAGTTLLHNHIPKAIVGQWLPSVNYQFDAGVPFVPYIPRAVLLLHFLLFSGSVTLGLLVFLQFRSRWPLWKSGLYIVALFTVLLHQLDGGFFAPQGAAGLLLLTWCCVGTTGWRMALGCGIALVPVWWVGFPGYGADIVYRLFAFYTLTLTVAYLLKKKRFILFVPAVLFISMFLLFARGLVIPGAANTSAADHQLRFALTPLSKGQRVYLLKVGKLPKMDLIRVMKTHTRGPYTLADVRLQDDMRMYELCRNGGLHLGRFPVDTKVSRGRVLHTQVLNPGDKDPHFVPVTIELPAGSLYNFGLAHLGPGPLITKEIRVVER